MVQIKFEVQGWDNISRSLEIMIKNTTKLKWFFGEALDIVEKRTDDIFSKDWQNVITSNKWKALSPSTKKARKNRTWYYKKAPSWRVWILHWTWNLLNNKSKIIKRLSWILKYNAPYAWYHLNWDWKLPKRKFLELDPKTKTLIVKALQKKIVKDIQKFNNSKGWFS